MSYPFGQSITYWFHPLLDNEKASIPAAILGQTPAIYIFNEQVPTRGDASTGTNSLATITSWTWNYQKRAWSFIIPAIDDPRPDSNIPSRQYWIAINFTLQAGEQLQTVIKPLPLVRVVGHDRVVSVTQDDLKKYFPQVEAYSSELQRLAFISQATEEVKAALRAKGYEWAKIQRADRLDLCVIYKALSMIMLGQIQEPNDKFSIKYIEYKQSFSNALDSLKFEYQAEEGGQVAETKTTATIFVVR